MSDHKVGGFLQNIFGFDNYSNEQQKLQTNPTTTRQTPPAKDEYIVKRGDTMTEIAIKTGQNLQELVKENPQIKNLNKIYVGQKIHIGGDAGKIYTVKFGDTLSEIAKDHKVSIGDILRANPGQIANRNLIYPGQKLNIPVHAGETSASKPKTAPSKPQPPVSTKPSGTTPPQVENEPKIEQPKVTTTGNLKVAQIISMIFCRPLEALMLILQF